MHFTYEELCTTELCQGDILERTVEIDDLLKLVHPHFYNKENNLFFMVLTQSCDLVRRDASAGCKAQYITIAPVRPIESVLRRQVAALQSSNINADLPVLTEKERSKLTEFLERIYDNNEPGFFFLESSGTPFPGDCCAYLNLSIAIKSAAHYQKCLDAKRLQLTDTFQAKLGWLVGQMYSRVGTEEWPRKDRSSKVQATLKDAALWIPDTSKKALEAGYKVLNDGQDGIKMTEQQIKDVLKKIPTKKSQVLAQIESVLTSVLADSLKGEEPERISKISKLVLRGMEFDAAFTNLTK